MAEAHTFTPTPTPSIEIAPFAPEDEIGLLSLLRELQAYYRVPCPTDAAILNDLRTLPNGVTLLVARAPEIVGMAALAAIWPGPGLQRGLFLKELFVAASHRSQGVGAALMRAAARFAVEGGFERIDWTADREDAPLLAFYRRLNAQELPAKLFLRITGRELNALTEK